MSSLPIPLSCLTSLSQSLQPLTSLLNSPSPPPFIYLHSPSNPFLTSQLIQQLLSQPYSSGDAPQLPRFAYADLLEIHNSRSLYDRLLNRLAAWTPEWTPAGCPSWNGQTQGLRLISSNSSLISQDQSSTDLSLSALAWDYDLNPDESPRLGLVNKKNESFDAFCDGLRTLSSLTYTYLDQVAIPVAQRPKFIIIDRASRLRDWKDVNLMAAFSRLPEISQASVHTIFISHLPWTKLRPRYGAVEPVIVSIPKLSDRDLVAILVAEGPPPSSDPPQAGDGQAQRCLTNSAPAFEPFVSFIVSAFAAQTASDLFELSSLISRLWPTWIKRVEDGEVSPYETAKLILFNRTMIEAEQQQYGSAVWHVPAFLNGDLGIKDLAIPLPMTSTTSGQDSTTSSVPGSPQKSTSPFPVSHLLKSPSKPNHGIVSPFTTPSKPRHYLDMFSPASSTVRSPTKIHLSPSKPYNPKFGPPLTARQQPQDTLSLSLPIAARYILIASYVSSYNPLKSDARLFVTFDEVGTSRGRRLRAAPKPKIGEETKVRERQQLLGPKPFPLSRLMAIFHAITNQEDLSFTQIDVLQQVGSLIQSRLLNRSSGKLSAKTANGKPEKLEGIKLICGISEAVAQSLSNSLGFDLRLRLWETED